MKKFTGILLSLVLILSTGTTVFADPDISMLTAPDENGADSAQTEGEENSDLTDNGTDSLLGEEGTDSFSGEDENESSLQSEMGEEGSEIQDSLTEETDEAGVESESEEDTEEEESEEDEEDAEEEDLENLELALLSSEVEVKEYKSETELSLRYDDRYDISGLSFTDNDGDIVTLSSDVEYVIVTEYGDESDEDITSYKVSEGVKSDEKDESLLTLKEDDSFTAIASGAGTGTVWLVSKDKEDDLIEYLEEGQDDTSDTDGQNDDSEDKVTDESNADEEDIDPEPEETETIEVYGISVTVEAAPLTLMFLVGQSNMEGYCDTYTGYNSSASIACEAGTVYSTYVPGDKTRGSNITGISFSNVCTSSSYGNAGDFVAGSIQDSTNMSGNKLEYPIYSLTTEGSGKTGPDSGMAYEWNCLTGDKVWVVNTAYGATNIESWVPGGNCYERTIKVWDYVLQTYEAEIEAGHYIDSKKLVFWQQGETEDSVNLTPDEYESQFSKMYSGMSSRLGDDALAFGIIECRAGYATNRGADYRDENDLKMTGPRIAQFWLGSSKSSCSNVYVASNVNEQWVSDSGVSSYFQSAYPGGSLTYPMHGYSNALPSTVSEVHYNIHYSQIGHNENGITAAYGMWTALGNASGSCEVTWRDEDYNTVSSMTLDKVGDSATVVPVVNPSYLSKNVSYSVSGNAISYDFSTGALLGNSKGTSQITPSCGSNIFSVTVSPSTDIVKVNGKWVYQVNGVTDYSYTGLAKNSNGWWYVEKGVVNFNYTGFAENSNGKWYCEDSKVTFNANSVYKDTTGAIGTKGTWYYVVGSKVQTSYTGLADYKNSNGWWYIKNGQVDFTANTVAKNKNGWWYIEGGKVIFSYNGFGSNGNGKWYCENGKVTFNKNSVIKDITGAIGTKGTWYYVVGSKVQTNFTGLANYKNSNGWWYIKNGVVDFTHNGVDKNVNGWWYVTDGKVQFGFTGLANYKNSNGWWYIKGGKVDFSASGVYKNKNGWYYVTGGKVDFSFNGVAKNSNGWWYIKGGKVDFSFNGTVKVSGVTYKVTNGKVAM